MDEVWCGETHKRSIAGQMRVRQRLKPYMRSKVKVKRSRVKAWERRKTVKLILNVFVSALEVDSFMNSHFFFWPSPSPFTTNEHGQE